MHYNNQIIPLVVFLLSLFLANMVLGVDCYTEIDPSYLDVDVKSLIHIKNTADADRIREDIVQYFWPGKGLVTDKMPEVVQGLPADSDVNWPNPTLISLPAKGLVGHWKFDGNFDDSVGGNNANVFGQVTVGLYNGVAGGGAKFVGNDYLTLNITHNKGDDWTIMCWVKGDKGNDGMFMASGYNYYKDNGGGWESVFLRYFSQGKSITGAVNWPNWHEHKGTGHTGEWPIIQEQWHHVALSYKDSTKTMKFYLDGELKKEGKPTFPGWFKNEMTLGGVFGAKGLNREFDYKGLIDDMRIYNRIVAEDEIKIHKKPLVIPDWILSINSNNLSKVDRIDIKMDYDMHSYVYHLHPKKSINRLLIFQMGHSNDILTAGGLETIKFFLGKGYSIMTLWMPLFGENSLTARNIPNHGDYTFPGASTGGHNVMSTILENSKGSFIRFFIEPVIVAINYAIAQYKYSDISMTGVSGGGWTTHVCAAIDPRIKLNFPVAGSLPLYLRKGPCANGSAGDAEQVWAALFEKIASWPDIYILGGYGKGRGQVHILNQYDSCCFWGVNFMTFEHHVTETVESLGKGFYYATLDSSHKDHRISDKVISEVIDKHLSSLVEKGE